MRTALTRGLILAAMIAALAGCSGAPPKADAPGTAKQVDSTPARRTASASRQSPYAAAQEDLGKRGNYTRGGLYAPGVQDSAPEGGIPDVDLIPEPAVSDEPHSRYGNRSPYNVLGKSYRVLDSAEGYDESGLASYYGNKFHGRRTSNLEVYDMYAFTAAHKTLPLPSYARVTNLSNGKSVVVRVNDRGPFHDGRIIDLSYAAAVKLGVDRAGTARVEVKGLSPGENARQTYDVLATHAPAPAVDSMIVDSMIAGSMVSESMVATSMASSGLLPPGVHIATGQPQPAPPSAIDQLVGALPMASANAGERLLQQTLAMPSPISAVATALATTDTDWRFDMRQDGRTMRADEFDAWMRARRAQVATGRPGTPNPRLATALAANGAPAALPIATAVSAPAAGGPSAMAPVSAVPMRAPDSAARVTSSDTWILQVASFAARANAERALAMLTGAGIGAARLLDADANGRRVWRLRVGPVDPSIALQLVARIQGLGFGQPQRVRE